MFVETATAMRRVVFPLIASLLFSGCAAFRPAPPPAPPAPVPPPVFKIPGEPVVLTPADRALGYFLKGKVALDKGDQETALPAFEQAVTNDSTSTFLRLQLAKLYVRKGKLEEALEHCRKVREQDPSNAEAELLMAGLLSSMNQEEEAAKLYETVLTRSPRNQEPYLYLGTLYAKQGKFEQAIAVLNKLMDVHPRSILGLYLSWPSACRGKSA